VALSERKDVDKKWGCSQLMFTFAAEWLQSDLRLDDATSREGRWFAVSDVDSMVRDCSSSIDPGVRLSA
jgi:NADH pyrophosphatase NudC (nudix superfamily)